MDRPFEFPAPEDLCDFCAKRQARKIRSEDITIHCQHFILEIPQNQGETK